VIITVVSILVGITSLSLLSLIIVTVVVSIVIVSCLQRDGAAMAAQKWAQQ
jgi:hypothetical protein